MINELRPLDGLNIRLPIQIPIKGRGFISQGFGLGDPIYEYCLKGFRSQPGRPGRTAKGFCKGLLAYKLYIMGCPEIRGSCLGRHKSNPKFKP